MPFASGIASSSSVLVSIRSAFERAASELEADIDFAILFVSGERIAEKGGQILEFWKDLAPSVPLFGGSAESLIGKRTEIEDKFAASVLLFSGMNQVPRVFELECIRTPDGTSVMGVTEELLKASSRGLMTMACPLSFSVELLSDVLDYERVQPTAPVAPILGGYCSSPDWQSPNLLFAGDRVLNRGAVVLGLPEGWEWRSAISQGCRPIGEPFVITAMDGQTVLKLGGLPAMEQLRALYSTLPVSEQEMVSSSLMMGRAISEYSRTFSHGEFLIRAVQGIDAENSGLVVTERFQVGQTVRFHVRDAETAKNDFQMILSKDGIGQFDPAACLLVSCSGRGTRFFSSRHQDALLLDERFPELPTAGFFAAGEFGPLANQNLIHGFTVVANFLVKKPSGS